MIEQQGQVQNAPRQYTNAELVSALKDNNNVYVFNTLLRTFGGIVYNQLVRDVLYSGSVYYGEAIMRYTELWKSLAITAGIGYSYFATARKRETNWSTGRWLLASTAGYSGLLAMSFMQSWGLSVWPIIIFNFALQGFFSFEKGVRDGVRPRHYTNFSRFLADTGTGGSDMSKQLLNERKIYTTVAETASFFLINLLLFVFQRTSQGTLQKVFCTACIAGNLLLYVYFKNRTGSFELRDPMMTDAQHDAFPGEVSHLVEQWKGYAITVMSSPVASLFTKPASLKEEKQNKFKKLLTCLKFGSVVISKSELIFMCYSLPGFDSRTESLMKGVSNVLNFGWDYFRVWYREQYGKHFISSIDSLLVVSATNVFVSGMCMLAMRMNSAAPIALVGFPVQFIVQSLMIACFTHLFENMGVEEKERERSVLTSSFELNMLSFLLNFLGKSLAYLSEFLKVRQVWLFLNSFLGIVYGRRIREIADKAEQV